MVSGILLTILKTSKIELNINQSLRGPAWPLILLGAALVISLLSFVLFSPSEQGRYFTYPLNSGQSIETERRGIPSRHLLENQVAVYMDELLIGPVDLALARTAPAGTRLRHAALEGKTIYIDLTMRMLHADDELPVSLEAALKNIRQNLLFNFPQLEQVFFTIEGKELGAPPYP